MSADHFHHQVELSMKRVGKVYDFNDFQKCVEDANSGHTYTKTMDVDNFLNWKSECSTYKLNKQVTLPLLNSIVHIKAVRGHNCLLYSETYDEFCPLRKLDFLKHSVLNNGVIKPLPKISKNGINPSKKESIIKNLLPMMPKNRKQFWLGFPVSEDAVDLYEYSED